MVALSGREVVSHALSLLSAQYCCLDRLVFGRPTTIARSRSLVPDNLRRPIPKAAGPQGKPIGKTSKRRKHGRVEPKRYNDLARGNSTIFIPGGFPKESSMKSEHPEPKAPNDGDDDTPTECDPESDDEGRSGQFTEGRRRLGLEATASEHHVAMRELGTLLYQNSVLENIFDEQAVSERLKARAAERKAKLDAAKLRDQKRREEQRRRKEEERQKDQRVAELQAEVRGVRSELAREKVQRQRSRYERVAREQERRRESDEQWRRAMDANEQRAVQREGGLVRENAILREDLEVKRGQFLKVFTEREHLKREREEERLKRLLAEERLQEWEEMMEEYFPEGQAPRQRWPPQPEPQQPAPPQPQSQPQQPPSPKAQFDLYEKKWEVLRSGVDVDGKQVRLIYFSEIPWPVLDLDPTGLDPSKTTPKQIVEFFLHPLRVGSNSGGEERSKKAIAKDELRRWHSDKFDHIVLSKVYQEHKLAAAAVAGEIAKILTDIKNSE